MIFAFPAYRPVWLACLIAVIAGLLAPKAQADLWRTAYYPGWEQSAMPAASIDFTALTHLVHFAVVPQAGGTLNDSQNDLTPANSADVVARAHAAGVKVLVCLGGSASESGFQGACSPASLPVLISHLTNFVAARGYDGVDVDWEPLPAADTALFTNLVVALRTALNSMAQPKLLTVAAGAYPPYGDPPMAEYQMYAALQNRFDQINLMTYDFSGPYDGWVTWFNSPIYDGGFRFPSSGGLVPSVDGAVINFLSNGVAPGRLGIGIAFYGYVWSGGSPAPAANLTLPRQSWTVAPAVTTYPYRGLMAQYYQTNAYHWDASAQAACLSITNASPANNAFISYDDPHTCQAKISYARNHRLGGVMIWELAQDHTPGLPDPLLQAIKLALATPGSARLQSRGDDISLTFTGIALGIYQVQWSSNLASGFWSPLATTNVSGQGGTLQIVDFGARSSQPKRYYRVQTPP